MKKDKEWLKAEVENILYEIEFRGQVAVTSEGSSIYYAIEEKIDELYEPEVKQIDKKIKELNSYNDELIRDNNQLRNELDNQEVLSQELPAIPQFVADWIEKYIEYGYDLYPALRTMENNSRSWKKTYDWYRKNTRKFVNAYLTGKYKVEEEQKLTARDIIEKHIELLKNQEEAVNLKPYYDLLERIKNE